MTPHQIATLRRGDTVSVRAKVNHNVDRGETDVHLKIGHRSTLVESDEIVDLLSRNFDKGDKVRCVDNYRERGEVIGVDDDYVWVRLATPTAPRLTFASIALELVGDDVLVRCPAPGELDVEVELPAPPPELNDDEMPL